MLRCYPNHDREFFQMLVCSCDESTTVKPDLSHDFADYPCAMCGKQANRECSINTERCLTNTGYLCEVCRIRPDTTLLTKPYHSGSFKAAYLVAEAINTGVIT